MIQCKLRKNMNAPPLRPPLTPGGYRETGNVQTHNVGKPTLNLLDMVQPVLSRGRLYIRTPEELICYHVAAE